MEIRRGKKGRLDFVITNLTVKILTNCHYLFGNPW